MTLSYDDKRGRYASRAPFEFAPGSATHGTKQAIASHTPAIRGERKPFRTELVVEQSAPIPEPTPAWDAVPEQTEI